jgi:methylphosphotriester-DNA--protein-cysteine methyltransferase
MESLTKSLFAKRPERDIREQAILSDQRSYRLLGHDGEFYASQTKGEFGGNRRGKIYGRLDCPSALRAVRRGDTYQRHRVFFADEATAVAAGYRPCGICMRTAYASWRQHTAKKTTPREVSR